MISPRDFVGALKKRGIRSFTGVPCSFFQAAINHVIHDRTLSYAMVPNEGSALALAAGAYLGGGSTAVLIQNSGFGNLVNPLTSLCMIYKIPALLFISGRAYGVPDEPQHEIIGKTMGPILDAIGISHRDLPGEKAAYEKALDEALRAMAKDKMPFAFFVRKDTINDTVAEKHGKEIYPLKRIEAIQIITDVLKGDESVIATTGKPSRELFAVRDRQKNFYMQGSMGHAPSIGLGLALEEPKKKVVVLDGDGAILMHMGILSSVGHYKPKNFYHIALDNESYETTGDQDTTSPTTDFTKVARACGYAQTADARSGKELKSKLSVLLKKRGPAFLRVKINRVPTANIPRISSKYASQQITENFRKALSK